jgi:hypothetical protein
VTAGDSAENSDQAHDQQDSVQPFHKPEGCFLDAPAGGRAALVSALYDHRLIMADRLYLNRECQITHQRVRGGAESRSLLRELSTETPMFGQRNVIIIIPKHTPVRP